MIEVDKYQAIVLTDCPFCKKAVDLLRKEKKTFSVLVLDHDVSTLNTIKTNTGHKTVPIIIGTLKNGQQTLIGGFTELQQFLQSQPKDTQIKDPKAEKAIKKYQETQKASETENG